MNLKKYNKKIDINKKNYRNEIIYKNIIKKMLKKVL